MNAIVGLSASPCKVGQAQSRRRWRQWRWARVLARAVATLCGPASSMTATTAPSSRSDAATSRAQHSRVGDVQDRTHLQDAASRRISHATSARTLISPSVPFFGTPKHPCCRLAALLITRICSVLTATRAWARRQQRSLSPWPAIAAALPSTSRRSSRANFEARGRPRAGTRSCASRATSMCCATVHASRCGLLSRAVVARGSGRSRSRACTPRALGAPRTRPFAGAPERAAQHAAAQPFTRQLRDGVGGGPGGDEPALPQQGARCAAHRARVRTIGHPARLASQPTCAAHRMRACTADQRHAPRTPGAWAVVFAPSSAASVHVCTKNWILPQPVQFEKAEEESAYCERLP